MTGFTSCRSTEFGLDAGINKPARFERSACARRPPGAELILGTDIGVALRAKMPSIAQEWAPEIYFAEVVLARHLGAALVTADLKLAGAPGIGVATITR